MDALELLTARVVELHCLQCLDDIDAGNFPLIFKIRVVPQCVQGADEFDLWVAFAPRDLFLVAEKVRG